MLCTALHVKMVQCFVPDCNHQSEVQNCSFLRFPKDGKEKRQWIKLIRLVIIYFGVILVIKSMLLNWLLML